MNFFTSFFAVMCLSFVVIGAVVFPGLTEALMYGLFSGLIATVSYLADKHQQELMPQLLNQSSRLRQEALNAKFAVERAENTRKLKEITKSLYNKEEVANNLVAEADYNFTQKQENEQAILDAQNLGDTDMNKTIKMAANLWEPKLMTINWNISKNNNYKTRCRYCNHAITDANSVVHGAGAVCRAKHDKDAYLDELEAMETSTLEYLDQPGLFAEQKFEAQLKLVKESFMKYTKWGKDSYLRVCASGLNRLMADKDVADFVQNDSGAKGKFWIQAKTVQDKDATALRHYFN
jgi:hypothetical protein